MTDKIATDILRKLDLLIALTALSATDKRTKREQIDLLGKAGLPPKDIANLVGTTPNAVSVALCQLKKVNKKTKKPKGKQ
jgi:hypothetical protein